jgi:nitroreductase
MPEIVELMKKRRSMRVPFDLERPVPKEQLADILEAARWVPSAHNMQNFEIVVVDDRKVLDEIASLERPVSEAFIRENYEQLSFSEEELLRRKTGLLASMFPPEWRDPDFALKATDQDAIASRQRALSDSPVLLVVVYDPSTRAPASEGDFLGIISLGCVMENVWLAAESMGIGVQIVSSLGSGPEVKRILGIPEELVVAFSVRLGYPLSEPAEYLRVRRNVEDFTHINQYGG